ncbi:MbcA/ParS/Xre antitoxin family protein [Vibrio vulnificus]|uniref:MbcA/ParS/Xre antitoxin family protein n=1 Tax=Vibrio vulnificus TaxID=672 RepID=UPI0024E002AE|nr:MbcA/ParS/Xre antitoxin family protein [Vibrio vulnificus]MDK2600823.1 MbcA/ParS/Xre antitoxin family protein [Vibrio vulnificus]MDK2623915.1 MbcA/ParS/Xre antitoxin family protein [Vibrio vulnificus]MDK2641042.1 MbcA/ParS/Xre antitoxin family protein [Vibrio vulnificus]MDK2667352.1 MbcA/ParS/Xre antitoxin family protein [Vibrio vulnificus]MDK2676734.1 MbcA/ParS/Xre antitoxin family protein [Vibrio vulnificus]
MKVKIEKTCDGEFFFNIPEVLQKELQWEENDQIEWLDNKDGSWTLRKAGLEDDIQSKSIEYIFSQHPTLKDQLEDVFEDSDLRIEWLTSAIPALSGLTPLEVVLSGGLKRVLDALNRIKYGDFS